METQERQHAQPRDLSQVDPNFHPMTWLRDMWQIFMGHRRRYVVNPDAPWNLLRDEYGNPIPTGPEGREGYHIYGGRELHPSVQLMIEQGWHVRHMAQLVLEWPTRSDDGLRLAYTQNEKKMAAGQRTVTSPGKYLTRHFVAPDHAIRDAVARFAAGEPILLHKVKDFIEAVQSGPKSCMQWGDDGDGAECPDPHPYACYDPRYGWRMAIRREGGRIVARALWLHHSLGPYVEGEKLEGYWVRTYKRCGDYSNSDEVLEAWFGASTSITKVGGWPDGTKMAKFVHGGRIIAPYVDGRTQTGSDEGSYLLIDSCGSLDLSESSGYAGRNENEAQCEDCDAWVDQDSMTSVGYYEDRSVCSSCLDDSWVYGRGRMGRSYYYRNDEDVEVDGEHYHQEYLRRNEIVELADGDYAKMDDAFCCEIRGNWYHNDDGVQAEDLHGAMVHEDEAWKCEASGEFYSSKVEPVEIDGETYHPDWVEEDPDNPGEMRVRDEPANRPVPDPNQMPLFTLHTIPHTHPDAARVAWSRPWHKPPADFKGWLIGSNDPTPNDGWMYYWDGTRWLGGGTRVNYSGEQYLREVERGDVFYTHLQETLHWKAVHPDNPLCRPAAPPKAEVPGRVIYAEGATHSANSARVPWARYKAAPNGIYEWRYPAGYEKQWNAAKEDEPGRWWLLIGYDINDRRQFTPLPTPIPEAKPATVAIDTETWREGPPPSEGWWNCSMLPYLPTRFRYWNGTYWSLPVSVEADGTWNQERVERNKTEETTRTVETLRWRHIRAPWDQPKAEAALTPVPEGFDDPADVPEGATHRSVDNGLLYWREREGVAHSRYGRLLNPGDRWDPIGSWEMHAPKLRPLNLPPAVPARPMVYRHIHVRDPNVRYRAGQNGRIDVFGLPGQDGPVRRWQLGRGEDNERLTSPDTGYRPDPDWVDPTEIRADLVIEERQPEEHAA